MVNNLDMKKTLLIALASFAAIAACQKNGFTVSPSQTGSIYATMEEVTDTRTSMDVDNNIRWSNGDRIIGFMYSTLGVEYQVNPASVGETSASFDEISAGGLYAGTELDHIIAWYPYSSSVKVTKSGSDYTLAVTLPADQIYSKGSFGNGAFPMVAVSKTNFITFKNVCGAMNLQLKGTQKVASVMIEGNNGEMLSGEATVTAYTDGSKPSISMGSDESTSVTLSCDPAIQLDENTATEFIITLPPTVFTKGFKVTVTDFEGKTYKVETDKENEILRSSLLVMPEVTLEASGQEESDDRWVDLGLSVLWAAYNVGASSPEEYGGYYAWGETSTKSDYTWDNYKCLEKFYWGDGPDDWYWDRKFIGNEISGTSYDVAHVQWGGGARMPTYTEVQELVNNCIFTGGSYNGVRGSYVTGPNGNSIFLPFAGNRDYGDLDFEGSSGDFWSGTYDDDNVDNSSDYAYCLICKEGYGLWSAGYRYQGLSVRPVTEK